MLIGASGYRRNVISSDKKFALDVWYMDNRSLLLDLKITWLTIRQVFMCEGIYAAREATVPKFRVNRL